MAMGPGKYDEALSQAKRLCGATTAILIVLDGAKGPGFSAQLNPVQLLSVPRMLRDLADQIERDAS